MTAILERHTIEAGSIKVGRRPARPSGRPAITDPGLSLVEYNTALARYARDPRALMGM
jgi:hypothetical protein